MFLAHQSSDHCWLSYTSGKITCQTHRIINLQTKFMLITSCFAADITSRFKQNHHTTKEEYCLLVITIAMFSAQHGKVVVPPSECLWIIVLDVHVIACLDWIFWHFLFRTFWSFTWAIGCVWHHVMKKSATICIQQTNIRKAMLNPPLFYCGISTNKDSWTSKQTKTKL